MKGYSLILIIMLFAALALAGTAQADIVSDWSVHLTFNGGVDLGGAGNLVDGGATLTEGVYDNSDSAYYFDGADDYLAVTNIGTGHYGPDQFEGWTVSLWFKTTRLGSADLVSRLRFEDAACPGNSGYMIGLKDEQLISAIWDSNGTQVFASSKVNYNDNEWHHAAMVIDRNVPNIVRVRLYFDGKQVSTTTSSYMAFGNLYFCNSTDFTIGARENWDQGHKLFFNGSIDNVRLYWRTLSATDIKELSVRDTDH